MRLATGCIASLLLAACSAESNGGQVAGAAGAPAESGGGNVASAGGGANTAGSTANVGGSSVAGSYGGGGSVTAAGGGGAGGMANTAGGGTQPAFSPDGERIAFHGESVLLHQRMDPLI